MIPFRRTYGLALMAFLMIAGCSSGDRPEIGEVAGIVTLDGKPMPDAIVQFKKGGFRMSQGFTNADGAYELIYLRDIKGAAIGENKVLIDRVTKEEVTPRELRLPARYNSKTELVETVEPGKNEINFDLTSQSGQGR